MEQMRKALEEARALLEDNMFNVIAAERRLKVLAEIDIALAQPAPGEVEPVAWGDYLEVIDTMIADSIDVDWQPIHAARKVVKLLTTMGPLYAAPTPPVAEGVGVKALPFLPFDTAPKNGTAFLAAGIHDRDDPPGAARGVKAGDVWWAILLYDIWREPHGFVFAKDGTPPWSDPIGWWRLPDFADALTVPVPSGEWEAAIEALIHAADDFMMAHVDGDPPVLVFPEGTSEEDRGGFIEQYEALSSALKAIRALRPAPEDGGAK